MIYYGIISREEAGGLKCDETLDAVMIKRRMARLAYEDRWLVPVIMDLVTGGP